MFQVFLSFFGGDSFCNSLELKKRRKKRRFRKVQKLIHILSLNFEKTKKREREREDEEEKGGEKGVKWKRVETRREKDECCVDSREGRGGDGGNEGGGGC